MNRGCSAFPPRPRSIKFLGGIFGGTSSVKATFFLPLTGNDGRDLSEEINQVEDACFDAFGAWTLTGYFKGAWRMETGERQLDTSAAYMVMLEEGRLGELEAILRQFKAATTQEALFLEIERDVDFRLI